jgi:arylsulfatase A-like enzyme
MRSFATLTGQSLPAEAGPDSFDMLPALLGRSGKGRDHIIEHARDLAIRKGNWKLIPAGAARQNAKDGPATREAELFDLARDIGETKNLAERRPDLVQEMTAMLEKFRAAGRTRP